MRSIILLLLLNISYSAVAQKSKSCKSWIFCPSSAIICSNNQNYQLMEETNGQLEAGITFVKNRNGCWVLSNQNQAIPEKKVSWFKKIFGSNSVKPKY